jgi:hypothetical protein
VAEMQSYGVAFLLLRVIEEIHCTVAWAGVKLLLEPQFETCVCPDAFSAAPPLDMYAGEL